ncbi:MAG TPA: hypothetical protein VLS89_10620 [Candidatus Nanopelagicales bacterium]|nr:hypothetical protein [Candidatus Nanopelagicales bacterium]
MTELLPGTEVELRGLRWEVVFAQCAYAAARRAHEPPPPAATWTAFPRALGPLAALLPAPPVG